MKIEKQRAKLGMMFAMGYVDGLRTVFPQDFLCEFEATLGHLREIMDRLESLEDVYETKSDKEVTHDDLGKIKHMVGADPYVPKTKWGFRNHYVPGADDMESMKRLENAGYIERGKSSDDLFFFHATRAGCDAIGLTESQTKRALGND